MHLVRSRGPPLGSSVVRTLRGGAVVSPQAFADAIASNPVGGTLAVMAAYCGVEVAGLPSTPLAMAMGFVYDVPVAFGLAMLCSTAAAFATFEIGRTALRPRCLRRVRENRVLRAVDAAVERRDFLAILLLRLFLPMPPAVNYLYGATSASWLGYACATVLGNAPGILFCVCAAKGLTLTRRLPWFAYVGLAALAALVAYAASEAAHAVKKELLALDDDD